MPLNEYKKQTGKNIFSKKVEFTTPKVEAYKAYRSEEVLNTTLDYGGNTFNVDEASMDRFNRVIAIASWKFNQTLATEEISLAQAYSNVYQSGIVTWKTHDNQFVELTIENICEIQELALQSLQQTWIKWG